MVDSIDIKKLMDYLALNSSIYDNLTRNFSHLIKNKEEDFFLDILEENYKKNNSISYSTKLIELRNKKRNRIANSYLKDYNNYILNKEISNKTSNKLLIDYLSQYNEIVELYSKQHTILMQKKLELDIAFQEKVNAIKEWKNSDNLSENPYLSTLTKTQQFKAFREDFCILFLSIDMDLFMVDKKELPTISREDALLSTDYLSPIYINGDLLNYDYPHHTKEPYIEMPNAMINKTSTTPVRAKHLPEKDKDKEIINITNTSTNQLQFFRTSKPFKTNDKVRSVVSMDYLANNESKIEALDFLDEKIFSSILSHRSEMFFQNRTIIIKSTDLLKTLYPLKKIFSKKDYAFLEERLFKLANVGHVFNYASNNMEKMEFFKLIDNFSISKISLESNGVQRIYEFKLNDFVLQAYISQQVTRVYGEYTHSLKNISWVIAFPLQQFRLALHYANKINNSIRLDFLYFYTMYDFRCSKKDAIIEIENALNEMKKAKFLIRESKTLYFGEQFEVTFLPFKEKELLELYASPTIFDFVENIIANKLVKKDT